MWLAPVAILCIPEITRAQERLQLVGCVPLNRAQVAADLELELGVVATSHVVVRVSCTPDALLLEVDDGVTGKRISRGVAPIDFVDPGAPRVVALLVSELVLASWAELLLVSEEARREAIARVNAYLAARERASAEQRAAPIEPAQSPPDARVRTAPTDANARRRATRPAEPPQAVQSADSAQPSRATTLDAFEIDAGARLRDGRTPFGAGLFGLSARVSLRPRWSIGLRASVEIADVPRAAGDVAYSLFCGGVVVGFELLRQRRFTLELRAEPRVGWARLDGRPLRSTTEGRALDAPVVELEVTLAPSMRFGHVHLALGVSVGATLLGPIGIVSGEPSVALPGFAAGLSLIIGLR